MAELLQMIRGPQAGHPLFRRWPDWQGPQLAQSEGEVSARLATELAGASNLVADAKVQGHRAIIVVDGGRMRVFGRHHDPRTWLPYEYSLALDICQRPWPDTLDTVLDAEIVWPAERVRIGLQFCATRLEAARELLYGASDRSLAWQRQAGVQPEIHVFDCLWMAGDITARPEIERKAAAARALEILGAPVFRIVPSVTGDLRACRDAAERWMADGYEGAVVKPDARAYSWQGSRTRSGWTKIKKSVDWRARHELGMQEVDAWVACLRPDGESVGLNMLVESSDGMGRTFACYVGDAPVEDREHPPAVGSVWRVDAAYYDVKTTAFRYLRLMEPRPDKQQRDCRVTATFVDTMALRVCNF